MSLKILTFSSLFPNNMAPHHGIFVRERMVHAAVQNEWKVTVVAPIPYYPPLPFGWRRKYRQVQAEENFQGLSIYHPSFFMIPKIGMVLQGILLFVSVLPLVRRLRDAVGFDCIDAHYVYPDGLAGVLLGKTFKKPVVITVRGSDVNVFQHFSLIRRWLRYALQQADAVIVVSQALRKAVMDLGVLPQRIHVVPNGVDGNKFVPMSRKESREKLGLPLDEKIFLSVGNLTENKGMDLLVRAFHAMRDRMQFSRSRLLIIGEGPQQARLIKLIDSLSLKNDVSLVGKVPHSELFLWYASADVFCLMSQREGWPNVLLEAMACGIPVLATRAGGIPEIVRSNELGMLVDREVKAIAEGMRTAFQTHWNSQVIRTYAESHSWREVSIRLKDIFDSVTHGAMYAQKA